jgi:hypothetical protein
VSLEHWNISFRKAKVAYFEIAIAIDKDISRFEVSMKYTGTVHILQSPQNLIEEKLNVVIIEGLIRFDQAS